MDWVPNEASLTQIVELLKESHSPDTETQRLVEQVLKVHYYTRAHGNISYPCVFLDMLHSVWVLSTSTQTLTTT